MQLDKTLIVIHERGLLEIFDLTLPVLRRYFAPLGILFAAGAIPFFLLNDWLLSWLLDTGDRGGFIGDESSLVNRFLWLMGVVVFIQAPLASVFVTKFLGESVFVVRPKLRDVVRDVLRLSLRLLWCHGIIRCVVWVVLLIWASREDYSNDWSAQLAFLFMFVLYCSVIRAMRPYINEIVVLEKNPLFVWSKKTLTIGKRSAHLHNPSGGELFARWIGSAAMLVMVFGSVFGCFLFVSGVMFNEWGPTPFIVRWVYPLSLWIVAGFAAVVRFLSYVDLRIRQEGWEVELLLRAEAARLAGAARW